MLMLSKFTLTDAGVKRQSNTFGLELKEDLQTLYWIFIHRKHIITAWALLCLLSVFLVLFDHFQYL